VKVFLGFLLAVFVISFATANRTTPPRRLLRLGVCVLIAFALASYRVMV
jgi:hypothetical protein